MVTEEIETNRDSSLESKSKSRSKSPFRPLASEDSLGNSNNSGSLVSERGDDDVNWAGFDDLSKRSASATHHSLASTATLTSHSSSNNSHSHSSRSPRAGISPHFHKSPKRSPRPGCLKNHYSDDDIPSIRASRQIASPPLSSEEDDRRQDKHDRRFSGDRGSKSPPTPDGNGLYYQPSKASLHSANINVPTKKPQRIRNRSNSKGAIRRKPHGENSNSSSQHTSEGSTSTRGSSHSRGSSHGSSHGRGHSREPPQPGTKSKKKSSPPVSQDRKQPVSTKKLSIQGRADFHESWPRHETTETKERKELLQKIKRKKQSPKIKSKPSQKNKVIKENKDEVNSGTITFLEDVATKKINDSTDAPPRKDRSGGLFKKSNSARSVKQRPSAAAAVESNAFPDRRSREGRERRSSAPAKALAAFNHYRKAALSADFDYDDDEEEHKQLPPPPQPPKEKVMLDVSELAALEIIRLGKDNSLKLDLYDLVNHLRQQQVEKSGHNR